MFHVKRGRAHDPPTICNSSKVHTYHSSTEELNVGLLNVVVDVQLVEFLKSQPCTRLNISNDHIANFSEFLHKFPAQNV